MDHSITAINHPPSIEMPRYKCHKEVWALKIQRIEPTAQSAGVLLFPAEAGYAPIEVSDEWFRNHKPEAGGYYVVYADGYKSYSPAKAFEDGYARVK